MKNIPEGSIDLVLCDLPYGMTANSWDSIIPCDKLWAEYKRILKSNGVTALCAMQPFASKLVLSNLAWFKYEFVWRKTNVAGFLNAKKQPLRNHESVLIFYEHQPTYHPQMTEGKPYVNNRKGKNEESNYGKMRASKTVNLGTRYPVTCDLIFSRPSPCLHRTQKPTALMEYLINTYTNAGDTVLDNCMGSGSTGVAAIKLERRFIGIEKDPTYFDIAKTQIEEAQEKLSECIPFDCNMQPELTVN